MIGRDVLPTATTYNYFFKHFSRSGKIEEGMNLYTKMVQSGYEPDRLTYQLLIKMLCEKERLELAVQLIREMNGNGLESDLATSTMLVHLLCRLRRYQEACQVFEDMTKRGLVPQYITYHRLVKELKRLGMDELVKRVSLLMDSVPHSTKLPGSFREREGDETVKRRKTIMKKARALSDALKDQKDPAKLKNPTTENVLESAKKLSVDIRSRASAFHATRVHQFNYKVNCSFLQYTMGSATSQGEQFFFKSSACFSEDVGRGSTQTHSY
ncbi:hypothetical protein J5N97_003980 [Dioscorea zingiberensis]|uniref:Pentatricopeptide repeat-containing protein n=1 Tax=Dioscorea zingiberensis TaxID=325984 RepID=A0A9D5HQY2_9LILI|nr:hypothetical protein J5N97_003980 [Dioscorea zingiberensis]